MFHKNTNEKIDRKKIIDFQIYYFKNPSQALIFIIHYTLRKSEY